LSPEAQQVTSSSTLTPANNTNIQNTQISFKLLVKYTTLIILAAVCVQLSLDPPYRRANLESQKYDLVVLSAPKLHGLGLQVCCFKYYE
jgi:hypothetical protein